MSSSPGANCLGSCLQWQPGGARAQWLWSSQAGNTDIDADTDNDFDDDGEDLFLAAGDDEDEDDSLFGDDLDSLFNLDTEEDYIEEETKEQIISKINESLDMFKRLSKYN